MNTRALLGELRQRDVHLKAENGRLHVDAPAGVVTRELKASLAAQKTSLMKLLAWEKRKLAEAGGRGLLIRWAQYPIWIKLHDPLTGEWHEVRASECLPGVVKTAEKYRTK